MKSFFWMVPVLAALILMSTLSMAGENIFHTGQTSASMLIKYAKNEMDMAPPEKQDEARKKYALLYDIYIKANSYAWLNKIFFWFSVVFALAVLLWPSLSVILKSRPDQWKWLKSSIVQTTVTAIAALMFTFYSQYKDKQTYAETLMRYVIFSEQTPGQLSGRIADELSRIDRGFSFSSILGRESDKKAGNGKLQVNGTD
ncbi:hypothetical protein [Desulfospira joergensenii]|uniref:hypothetical protein n=1 Tax=Desulfospira joergensenii TaxID=53329 RepID=UPI0003B4454E|nr:hypothetical protein [Desulfospira joergensenii]